MKTYVLYHGECPDGFTAAWAFWQKLGDKAEYYPVKYGKPLPEMEKGAKVYIVDFSYSRDELLKIKENHPDLFLLDHHKTAEASLKGLDFAHFDMTKSGAVLAWEYLNKDKPAPKLTKYVEDQDLWNWVLENSKEVNAFIGTNKYDFNDWEMLAAKLENELGQVVDMGKVLLENDRIMVDSLCKTARMVKFAGHKVPCANAPVLHSKTGHELLIRYKEAPFAMTWFMEQDGKVGISLRSRGDFDVSEVAKQFGGGGHKAASGCRIDTIPGL